MTIYYKDFKFVTFNCFRLAVQKELQESRNLARERQRRLAELNAVRINGCISYCSTIKRWAGIVYIMYVHLLQNIHDIYIIDIIYSFHGATTMM